MGILLGNSKAKLFLGEKKIKKAYWGEQKIYSSGYIVTYIVDTGVTYTEEVEEGASCTHPTSFTPSKSGWIFVGWKSSTATDNYTFGDGTVPDKVMGDEPITLYALFKQTITLSYNGNNQTSGSVSSQTGTRYYNNGNTENPSFILKENGFTKTSYSFAKWAEGSTSGTQHSAGVSVELSSNKTFYAYWVKTVTEFEYISTNIIQSFTALVAGTYKLSVWGAQGDKGNVNTSYNGGKGGYAYGNVYLEKNQTIYICVGKGSNAINASANFNGGGSVGLENGTNNHEGGAGGGATHIARVNRGELYNYENYQSELFIVAGGGGGAGSAGNGGTGGGETGGNGTYSDGTINPIATGGTQSSGNAFGKGASTSASAISGAGGGGYFGGKLGSNVNGATGAGGGSGYTGGVTNGNMQNGVRSGNGKASVEFISAA